MFLDGSLEPAVEHLDLIGLSKLDQYQVYHNVQAKGSRNPHPYMEYLCRDNSRQYQKYDIDHQVLEWNPPHQGFMIKLVIYPVSHLFNNPTAIVATTKPMILIIKAVPLERSSFTSSQATRVSP